MEDVDIARAKECLEELIDRARRGEDVRISGGQGGAVRLVLADARRATRPRVVFGQWKHLAEIPEDLLLAPLDEDDLAWLSGERSTVE